jgi:UDP:flavonoid glycosyltransferase YjiC (YdhE family)
VATIAFFPEGAYGPTNNCVGIGDVLRGRGHRVVFIIEESFAGALEAQGFEERLMRLGPPPETSEVPGQFWKDFVKENAPVFRRPTIEQVEGFMAPTFQALADGSKYVDARLTEILDELRPGAVVEDNVIAFPALPAGDTPWARIVSCNPLELPDAELPPPYSGHPLDDRSAWGEFREEYRRLLGPVHADFDDFCRARGAPALPELEFMHESRWLNLYGYPEEVDYTRGRALGPTWHNVQASVRTTEAGWHELDRVKDGDGALVYLSLGSLGSADVELMQRLIDALATSDHRVVVSMGPRADELHLADNMVGDEFLPQTTVLPEVDVVITHGGNNTVVESLYFGKPMVLLPLFWDQHDNAERMHETGFGVRLSTYEHDPSELLGAIDHLRADSVLAERLAACSHRLQAFGGAAVAADHIERLASG